MSLVTTGGIEIAPAGDQRVIPAAWKSVELRPTARRGIRSARITGAKLPCPTAARSAPIAWPIARLSETRSRPTRRRDPPHAWW